MEYILLFTFCIYSFYNCVKNSFINNFISNLHMHEISNYRVIEFCSLIISEIEILVNNNLSYYLLTSASVNLSISTEMKIIMAQVCIV